MNAAQEEAVLRRALYGGILSSLCAAMGWLLWLFGQALEANPASIAGPLIGALLSVVVKGIEHYHEVAKFEREGGKEGDGEEEGEAAPPPPPRSFWTGILTSLVPLVTLFTFLTCEHVLGELLHEYLAPFAASVAVLFPVGAIFALVFGEKQEGDSFASTFVQGVFVGGLAALLAGLVQWLMTGHVGWGGLLGWWIIVGIGLSFAASDGSLSVRGAMGGALIAMILAVVFSVPGPIKAVEGIPFMPLQMIVRTTGVAVSGALDEPDLPGRAWFEAEKREEEREARRREDASRLQASYANVAFDDWVRSHPEEPTEPEPKEWPIGRWIADRLDYDPRRKADAPPDPFSAHVSTVREMEASQRMAHDWGFSTVEDRRDSLCRQLLQGWNSTLLRSWIVMLLFCFGLGLSPSVEREMRPSDYPSSRTARNDRILGLIVVAFLALVCVGFRVSSGLASGQEAPKAVPQNDG